MMKAFLLDQAAWALEASILILRLFIGSCLVVHGLGKLGVVGSGNLAGFTGWLASLGLPFPAVQARLAMLAELIGGAFIVVGFLSRPALAVCAVTLLVAAVIGPKAQVI